MRTKPEACKSCPAYEVGQGFVPPAGPADARLAIIGQGPGRDECELGEPFIGPSGRHLSKWLVKAGIPREKCAVSNVVQCFLPKNRKPTPKEVAFCWDAHLAPYLRTLPNLRVIVAAGVPAAQKFIKGAKQSTTGTVALFLLEHTNGRYEQAQKGEALGTKDETLGVNQPAISDLQGEQEGTTAEEEGSQSQGDRTAARQVYVVPIVHPAAIVRGAWEYDPAQPRYLRRAWDIATSEFPPNLLDVKVPPPGASIAKTVHEVAAFLGDLLIRPPPFVYPDIEGTGGILIGIGFWVLNDSFRPTGEGMYVPFRDFAKPYWSEEDTHTAAYWVDRVLASEDVPKVFQNGSSFDIPFLEEIGFEINNYADDTMVRAWAIYHEMPKGLEELAILYANLNAWKFTSHVGEAGDNK